jgi:hypothetical protein
LENDQREFLLDWTEGLLKDISTDYGPDGELGPETVYFIRCLKPLIAWLRGKAEKPGTDVREWLEERLEGFEDTVNYQDLAYEHDALVAAIEGLR